MNDVESIRSALVADQQSQIEKLRSRLAEREQELVSLKGRCKRRGCPLHFEHSGPCETDGS